MNLFIQKIIFLQGGETEEMSKRNEESSLVAPHFSPVSWAAAATLTADALSFECVIGSDLLVVRIPLTPLVMGVHREVAGVQSGASGARRSLLGLLVLLKVR